MQGKIAAKGGSHSKRFSGNGGAFMITERVKAVVANQFDVEEEEINSDMTLGELGADALDIVELVDALAEEFDCDIPQTCADSIETVGDAVKCVKKYMRLSQG